MEDVKEVWYTELMRGMYRALGWLKSELSNRGLGINEKNYEGVSVPTALYGAEAWGMKCLRSSVEVSQMDRVRNQDVRSRAGTEKKIASRAEQRELRWFDHVERMDEYCMAGSILMAEVSGGQVRCRPRLCWMDGVKVALDSKRMTVEAAQQCAKD